MLWFDKKDAMDEMQAAVECLKMHFKQVHVLDLDDWSVDTDAGDCLANPKLIEEALRRQISVYTLDYERWKYSF